MKLNKSKLRYRIKIKEGLTSEARTYNFMVTHTKSGDTSQVNAENGNEAIMKARTGELEKHGGPEGDYKVKKLTEAALRKMIKEDLEVILTNEEASDFFDIDPKELLGEFVEEAMGRASKATKTPPDATKAEKKAANKRVRKAGKEDSKKELDEAVDPVDAVEDSIEAMPEDEQQKLLDTLMDKLESSNLEESKKNPIIAALTKLPGGRDLAAVYYASLDRDTPTKLRIMAAIAIVNLIAPGDVGTLMGLDFLGPLTGLDDYLLIRRMMKKYKKAGLPAEKHHDQVQAAAGETLSPERSAEREVEKTRDLGKARTGAAIAKARAKKTMEEGKLSDLKNTFDRFLIKN